MGLLTRIYFYLNQQTVEQHGALQLELMMIITTRHQFFVWSTIDQSTGHLWFVFYDRRNTTGSVQRMFMLQNLQMVEAHLKTSK